jgi:D-glucosaminate-specific PTS system IIA component
MGNQIWVAVLCHGNWGKELIEDIKKLFGLKNKFLVFPLLPNMSVEEYREEVEKVLKVAPQNTILISDLYGGTTSNIAIYMGMKYNLNAISGLNLPLILEVDKEKEIEKILENLFLKENRSITCVNLIEEFKKM